MARKAFKDRVKDETEPVVQRAQKKLAIRGNNKYKGPEVGKNWAQPRSREEVSVHGVGSERGNVAEMRLEPGYTGPQRLWEDSGFTLSETGNQRKHFEDEHA